MLAALCDIVPVFRKALHVDGEKLIEKYSDDVYTQLKAVSITRTHTPVRISRIRTRT